jgi:hypothetical protein
MADAHTPLNIRYETEHCIVRELELTDPLEVIGGWMAQPDIAKGLNAPARVLDIEDLRKYVTSHNRIDSHALGVFDRKTGTLKGLWSVQVDWKTKEFLVNVLLAEKIDSDVGGIRETGRPLYAIMFDDLGMEALRYNVLESNDKVLWRPTRPPEHITKINTSNAGKPDAIHHFRITREQHYENRSRWAERDEQFRQKREELRQQRG